MKTAVWITKKLNLAVPRDAIGLDLADFPEARGWSTLSFKRRALVRLAFENVQAFSAPPAKDVLAASGSAASIATTAHALNTIQHQEGIATSAALAKRAVYEARSKLNVPDGDGMLSLRCQKETGAWDRCHHLLSRPVFRDKIAQAYDIVRALWMDLPVACEGTGRFAALAVREALVLEICCTSGSLSDLGFLAAPEQANCEGT